MTNNPKLTRRGFVKTSGAAVAGALSATSSLATAAAAAPADHGAPESDKLPMSSAGYRTGRVEALFNGTVEVEGCETQFQKMGISDINTNVFSGPQSLDFAEIGLHPFMLAYANDGFREYTLLPVFLARVFRHKSIFIRTDRGIRSPSDLVGKRIATPGYASTSLTWIRGMLQDEYGVSSQDVEWVFAQADSSADVSGKASAQEQTLPDGISVTSGPPGKDESDLLESGEVDALFHAAEPRAWRERNPDVGRLFADSRQAEQAYFAKTGIFPIMHAVAIKVSHLEENPWLAKAVFEAYSAAKTIEYRTMSNLGWWNDMLPWYGQELDETRELMGPNFYSYGLDAQGNRKTLETLFRYSHEQGLASTELAIDELFHPLGRELGE